MITICPPHWLAPIVMGTALPPPHTYNIQSVMHMTPPHEDAQGFGLVYWVTIRTHYTDLTPTPQRTLACTHVCNRIMRTVQCISRVTKTLTDPRLSPVTTSSRNDMVDIRLESLTHHDASMMLQHEARVDLKTDTTHTNQAIRDGHTHTHTVSLEILW